MCDDGSMACSESDCSSDSEEIESGCDLPENNLYLLNGDVLYNSSSDIGGFQFSLDGGSLSVLLEMRCGRIYSFNRWFNCFS